MTVSKGICRCPEKTGVMESVRRARAAALDHTADIAPPRLAATIEDRLQAASMVPGALTTLSARAVVAAGREVHLEADGGVDRDAVDRRAAGVQLIYEGLALTRSLVAENPWEEVAEESETVPADVEVLAADVLVARGFTLLARTDAAPPAVETIRAFGRQRTDHLAGRSSPARSLEANAFDLAAVAGATAVDPTTPTPLRQYVVGLARAHPETPLPPAGQFLPETVEDVLERVSDGGKRKHPRPQSPD